MRTRSRWGYWGLGLLLALNALGAIAVSAQSGTVDWKPPSTLSNTLPNSEYPAIVADRFGYVHVLWSEDVGGPPMEDDKEHPHSGNSILYTRWDGTCWSPPVDILLVPGEDIAAYLAVHVDANGELHAVWEGQTNFYYSHAAAWQAHTAQAWSMPAVIATGSARSRWTSSIVSDPEGNLHVAYATGGSEAGVYHILSQDKGRSWNLPVKLSEPLDALEKSFSNVQLTIDRAQRLHAVWQTNEKSGYGQAIYYARSVDNGLTWSPALQLRYRGPGDTWVELPYLVAKDDSELHLIYINGTNVGRAHRISRDGGQTWSEARVIITELEGINGYVFPLIDGAGQMYLIANMRTRDQVGGIFYARWLGDGWSRAEPFVVRSPHEAGAHWTAGAVLSGNELHIVWTQLARGEIGYISGIVASASPIPALPTPSPVASPTPTRLAIVSARLATPTPQSRSVQRPASDIPQQTKQFVLNPLFTATSLSLLLVGGAVLWIHLRRP